MSTKRVKLAVCGTIAAAAFSWNVVPAAAFNPQPDPPGDQLNQFVNSLLAPLLGLVPPDPIKVLLGPLLAPPTDSTHG